MVHSDWGTWLPEAIEDAEPDGVELWYLGCNGFVLKADDGTTILIDPYLGTGDPPRTVRMIPVPFDPADVAAADAVLATHEHTDHVHGPSQAPILENTDATFYGPSASVETAREWIDDYDVGDDDFRELAEGDTVEIGSLSITVEPANDPDAVEPVSYVVEHEAGVFFHGGDGRPDDVLAEVGERYDIDLGVVAFGSDGMLLDKETREPKHTKWYADENEAARAAAQLQLDRLVPTHWDMWKGLTADPGALRPHVRTYDYPRSLEVLEIGDKTSL